MFRPLFSALWLVGLLAAQAAEPHPSLPPPVIPDCLGVNIHFTDPRPGELEMLAAAGFKWVRMDLGWEATEKKKGAYDFSAYDRLVAALDKFKIRAVFILDYGNPLYAEPGDVPYFTSRAHTPEFREAFGKWAVAAVQHFKGRGYLWEMWNEPNGGFWKSPDKTGDYIALAKSTGAALREAGLLGPKGEAFIGPATSEIPLPYLEACFQAGLLDYWDAVSVHPYRQGAPETVEEEYRSLRLLIRKYAPKDKVIPIISGEWGYSSAWNKFDEEKQAKYLPRELLTNIANDVALSIWYDWHEDGTDPKEGEHHFGIVRNEYQAGRDLVYDPKPAYTAMKTLSGQLGGFRFNKRINSLWDARFELLFERNHETRVAFWHAASGLSGGPTLLREDAPFDLFTLLGKKISVGPGNLGNPGLFGAAPCYVSPVEEIDVRRFQFAAAFRRLPLELLVHVPGDVTIAAYFQNPFHDPLAFDSGAGFSALRGIDDMTASFLHPSYHPPPRFEVPSGNSFTEYTTARINNLQSGHGAVQWASMKGWSGFSQWTAVVVTNSMAIEELNAGSDFLLIRVDNPSGEPFAGTAQVSFSGYGTMEKTPLEIGAGEKEKLIRIAIVRKNLAELKSDEDWRSFNRHAYIDKEDSDDDLSIKLNTHLRRVFTFDLDPISKVTATVDGDAQVKSNASISATQPASDGPPLKASSVKLAYRFASGWKFIQLASPVTERFTKVKLVPEGAEPPSKFALWLHGDGKGCQARIRFTDSTGQTFQPDGPKIDWQGWRYVTFPMQTTEEDPLAHWGGANDGVIHYPIQWDSIFLLDNVSRQPVEGEIYLSAPTLIY